MKANPSLRSCGLRARHFLMPATRPALHRSATTRRAFSSQ